MQHPTFRVTVTYPGGVMIWNSALYVALACRSTTGEAAQPLFKAFLTGENPSRGTCSLRQHPWPRSLLRSSLQTSTSKSARRTVPKIHLLKTDLPLENVSTMGMCSSSAGSDVSGFSPRITRSACFPTVIEPFVSSSKY